MSSLTSSQINQSYQGLLKLADSTTGITSSLQSVQDGLGNDTGVKIAVNSFTTKNSPSLPYYSGMITQGEGFNQTAQQFPAGSQNILIAAPIYDNGLYTYSAMSYYVQTLSAVDTVEMAFYSNQYVPNVGLAPKDLIISGITLENASTGVKTATLPSNFSFNEPNIYWMVLKVSNSGVQPVVRFAGVPNLNNAYLIGSQMYGSVLNTASSAYVTPWKTNGTGVIAGDTIFYPSLSTFPSSFSVGDVSAYSTTLTSIRRPGYVFHCIN